MSHGAVKAGGGRRQFGREHRKAREQRGQAKLLSYRALQGECPEHRAKHALFHRYRYLPLAPGEAMDAHA